VSKLSPPRRAGLGLTRDPAEGDPDGGSAPGTALEDIPDGWVGQSEAVPSGVGWPGVFALNGFVRGVPVSVVFG
jgi:hypothetical protein